MKQDMTAREYATAKIIRSKELMGQDRRDMTAARAAAAVVAAQASDDHAANKAFRAVTKVVFPLEIPEREQTQEEMIAALMGMDL